jgi:hypothetical protein
VGWSIGATDNEIEFHAVWWRVVPVKLHQAVGSGKTTSSRKFPNELVHLVHQYHENLLGREPRSSDLNQDEPSSNWLQRQGSNLQCVGLGGFP